MLKSMTGFGTGRARAGDEEISVEVRAVNHKHLEVKVRLPRELSALEPAVLRAVRARCVRGAVEVAVRRSAGMASGAVPTVDAAMARAWREALRTVARAVELADVPTAAQIATQPGVVRMEEPVTDLGLAEGALDRALAEALDVLVAMREREGRALAADLWSRLGRVATLAGEVAELAPRTVESYRARLQERLAELLKGAPVDEARLVQEVALFAERTDVAEEATRLQAHLEAFRGFLAGVEPAGRRMDFLVQEMHREVNTTGSKSQSTEISTRIVELKAELERIREQVQNVE
ncbi:MAG TPA: YicC/YloC family endoribonuclease [Myxococcaceae bacterium]|nr:YicC/YloC family endoribonuclease [Myxococcaceae bacterium]